MRITLLSILFVGFMPTFGTAELDHYMQCFQENTIVGTSCLEYFEDEIDYITFEKSLNAVQNSFFTQFIAALDSASRNNISTASATLYIQRHAEQYVSDSQPGILLKFKPDIPLPDVLHLLPDFFQSGSIVRLKGYDTENITSTVFHDWIREPGYLITYNKNNLTTIKQTIKLLKDFLLILQSFNALRAISLLRSTTIDTLRLEIIKEYRTNQIRIRLNARSPFIKPIDVASHLPHKELIPVVQIKKRWLSDSGQHRILRTQIDISIRQNQCHIHNIEVFPSEVFVDPDEIESLKSASHDRINFHFLTNVHIENPSYLAHPIIFALFYNLEDPTNSLPLLELPIHLRYGKPCPDSPDINDSSCSLNNGYREFRMNFPIVSISCDGHEILTVIRQDSEEDSLSKIYQPVGNYNHLRLVKILTILVIGIWGAYLFKVLLAKRKSKSE